MGRKNFLVEGVSCSGKTTVCRELQRRGFEAFNGDTELAYQGDSVTGVPTDTLDDEHHLWDEQRARSLAADQSQPATFFCGGSRNFAHFLDVFDQVFVLTIDKATLVYRLDVRPEDEFGSSPEERAVVLDVYEGAGEMPDGISINTTRPLDDVVHQILQHAGLERTLVSPGTTTGPPP